VTILDTSVWIAFLRRQAGIFEQALRILEDREALAVECVFGELLQGARSERELEVIVSYWNHLPKASVPELWIEAGRYAGARNLASRGVGLIDAAIIICALQTRARIWTLDKKLLAVLERGILYTT
jgi:predicted nucleic acid-binding protein